MPDLPNLVSCPECGGRGYLWHVVAYWPEPGERLDISRLDRRLTAAIAQIDIDETLIPGEDGGPPQLLRRRTKLKLHNKVTALEKLALHLGLFDNAEKDSLVTRAERDCRAACAALCGCATGGASGFGRVFGRGRNGRQHHEQGDA